MAVVFDIRLAQSSVWEGAQFLMKPLAYRESGVSVFADIDSVVGGSVVVCVVAVHDFSLVGFRFQVRDEYSTDFLV